MICHVDHTKPAGYPFCPECGADFPAASPPVAEPGEPDMPIFDAVDADPEAEAQAGELETWYEGFKQERATEDVMERLRRATEGAKGSRPDYLAMLSTADATAIRDHVTTLTTALASMQREAEDREIRSGRILEKTLDRARAAESRITEMQRERDEAWNEVGGLRLTVERMEREAERPRVMFARLREAIGGRMPTAEEVTAAVLNRLEAGLAAESRLTAAEADRRKLLTDFACYIGDHEPRGFEGYVEAYLATLATPTSPEGP